MERNTPYAAVRKVLLSPKLEGKAGREHLAGILGFLDAGHVWDIRILRSESELTPGIGPPPQKTASPSPRHTMPESSAVKTSGSSIR